MVSINIRETTFIYRLISTCISIFYIVVVSHTIFLKKQPFLDFVCEIMLHSPSGKRTYGHQRNVQKADRVDVLKFLDMRSSTYQSEVYFLLKHCKRKYFYLSL